MAPSASSLTLSSPSPQLSMALYKSRYYTHCHRVQHGMRNLTCRNVRSGICVQIHARPCLKHGSSRAIQLCDVGAAAICFSMLVSIPAKSDDWDRLVGCTPRRQDHARRRVRVIASGLARRVCGSVPAPRAVPLVLGWLEVEVVDEVIKEEAALPMPPSLRVAREPDGAVRRDHHRLLRVPRRGALKHRRWLAKGRLVYLLVPRNSQHPNVSAGRASSRTPNVKLGLGIVFDRGLRKNNLGGC